MQKRKPGQPHKGWKAAAKKRLAKIAPVANTMQPASRVRIGGESPSL